MQVPIVSTKVKIPPVQRELVARPRLIQRLDEGLEGKLTVVSTPAGYGKTILLSSWALHCKVPVCWLSLDEADNDLVRFLLYLVAALEPVRPGIARYLSGLLQQPQMLPGDDMLAGIINEIARVETPFVLIVDDYHLIKAPAIHNSLIYLLHRIPAQMHLVIASRADPPLQLARLRARSELTELRIDDLCFTLEETTRFFNQLMNLGLDDVQVAILADRTEGWIAGLQMAAISLRGAVNPEDLIRSFSGSNRFILDFLVEEVLLGQPEEIQSFLMKTSILEQMTGPLCDAVTGERDSSEKLEHLERSNLFIIPIDEQHTWYRYHQLFLDLLRKRARLCCPDEIPVWHEHASMWFERTGRADGAIHHALEAEQYERAAVLIENAAQPVLMRSEIYTFRTWIARLPEDVLQTHPDLYLYHAWVLALSGEPLDAVENQLRNFESHPGSQKDRSGLVRGYLLLARGDTAPATSLIKRSLEALPEGDSLFRKIADYLLSSTDILAGRFDAGTQRLEEIVRNSIQNNQPMIAAGALCALAEIHIRQGELRAAQEDFERALEVAKDAHGQRMPVAARALMGLSDLWREWNDLERASALCEQGIELAKYLREGAALAGYITLARIKQAQGKAAEAQAAIDTALKLAQQTKETEWDDVYVRRFQAALHIQQGNLEAVDQWIRDQGLTVEFDPLSLDQKDNFYHSHLLKYELMVLARWLIAKNKPREALIPLNHVMVRAEEQGRIQVLIEDLLLSALAFQKLGEDVRALESIIRALNLAERGGYQRLFLDEGLSVRPVLLSAARETAASGYARKLLAAMGAESQLKTAEQLSSQPLGLEEPLTEREVELLQLIAAGLSNREIAQRLYISLPTVKWHTGNILSKLGANNRTQAVAIARSFGFLPEG